MLLNDVAIQYTEICTIGDIPYRLVFGQLTCVGISALPLDASVLTHLATEAQLNRVCDNVGKVNVLHNETAVVVS